MEEREVTADNSGAICGDKQDFRLLRFIVAIPHFFIVTGAITGIIHDTFQGNTIFYLPYI
jgi:hypothetical protein